MSVYFYGCITLDGYLADKNHNLDWLYESGSPEETSYESFYNRMDITIMGKRTFNVIKGLDDIESIYPTTDNYVFTHEEALNVNGFTPVSGDVVEFVKQIDCSKNVWIVGGNTLLAPLLDNDLIDNMVVQIAPVLLGDGIPLFTQKEGLKRFVLSEVNKYGQFAEMVYSRKPAVVGNMSHEIDFSNPEEANVVLEHLGGEGLLKARFPKVYQAFLNTIDKHKALSPLSVDGRLEEGVIGLKNGAFVGPISLKSFGKTSIEGRLGDENTNNGEAEGLIIGMSSVQGTEDWPVAYISGYMKDETDGEMIHTFSQRLSGTNSYDGIQHHDVRDLNQLGNHTLTNCIQCTSIGHDNTLLSLKAENRTFVLNGLSSNVDCINIDDPRSMVGHNPIRMMYARKPGSSEMSDYIYPDNRMISSSNTVKTLFPVKGKITFKDDLIPIGYNTELSKTLPTLKYLGKGVCTYNYTQEEIASCFKISSNNPQVVEFQLKEDWKSVLGISAYEGSDAIGNIRFEFSFYITAKIRDTETVVNQAFAICSTETLGDDQAYYDSSADIVAYLPPISIQWGCFGKETKFLMMDLSEKPVSELLRGDMIVGEQGCLLEVHDIVSGYEETIYKICTVGGKQLEVTGEHPLATKTGTMRARDITSKMILLCADEREDEVEFCYKKPYEDTVYNIVTEGISNWVIANGILAGNFSMQNEFVEPLMTTRVLSDETLQLKVEFDKLIDYLNTL